MLFASRVRRPTVRRYDGFIWRVSRRNAGKKTLGSMHRTRGGDERKKIRIADYRADRPIVVLKFHACEYTLATLPKKSEKSWVADSASAAEIVCDS